MSGARQNNRFIQFGGGAQLFDYFSSKIVIVEKLHSVCVVMHARERAKGVCTRGCNVVPGVANFVIKELSIL